MKQAERTRSEKFVVRFPLGMRDWVARAAGVSHRSMNAEIVARLRPVSYTHLTLPTILRV